MVNEEVLGGLKSAVERGQSLQRAMMTLYNSGYKKEEIEEAARTLMQLQPQIPVQPPAKTVPRSPEIKQIPQYPTVPQQQFQIKQPVSQYPPQEKQGLFQRPQQVQQIQPAQKISEAQKPIGKKKSREKTIIVVLIFLLIFLLGLLAVIFIFRQQLIDYISNFFG